jgi:hypothetical protein
MPAKNLGRLVILPALFVLFYAALVSYGHAVERWIPKWDTLAIICVMIILECAYAYKYAVSQRSVLARDITSSLVNLYVTGAVAGMVFVPILVFFPQVFWGRKLVFTSPEQLGPVWLQVLVILLLVSLFRYWMHRWQHKNEFLWELHSYHHRVTDLKASNLLVSHPIDFALPNVLVYIVLGILYESTIHPITILSTLPSAGIGALLMLMAFHFDLSVIALVGIILLIGIVKKNAIMLIDFALDAERSQGMTSEDAIYRACALRFRPILMTTMAALLGAVPLMLGTGTGSEIRQPLGYTIVGGLLLSQLLTIYTTPVVYLYLDRFRLWIAARRGDAGAPADAHALPAE